MAKTRFGKKKRRLGWKGVLACLLVAAAAFLGLRTYLTVKPVDYPVNHDKSWNEGKLVHILPTVNHERFLIKASFKEPLESPPVLKVGTRKTVRGVMTDTEGRFWRFDASGLSADTEYNLTLKTREGEKLCESWPLETFPAPDASTEHVRLLIYT